MAYRNSLRTRRMCAGISTKLARCSRNGRETRGPSDTIYCGRIDVCLVGFPCSGIPSEFVRGLSHLRRFQPAAPLFFLPRRCGFLSVKAIHSSRGNLAIFPPAARDSSLLNFNAVTGQARIQYSYANPARPFRFLSRSGDSPERRFAFPKTG